MQAAVQRYAFEEPFVAQMAKLNDGEAAAIARCIKHLAPLTDPILAKIKILLRDALIMQVTSAEPVPESDLNDTLSGPRRHHI